MSTFLSIGLRSNVDTLSLLESLGVVLFPFGCGALCPTRKKGLNNHMAPSSQRMHQHLNNKQSKRACNKSRDNIYVRRSTSAKSQTGGDPVARRKKRHALLRICTNHAQDEDSEEPAISNENRLRQKATLFNAASLMCPEFTGETGASKKTRRVHAACLKCPRQSICLPIWASARHLLSIRGVEARRLCLVKCFASA